MTTDGRARARALYLELLAHADGSSEDFNAAFDAFGESFAVPEGTEIDVVDAGGVPAEWQTAPGASAERTVVYFHGGGFASGSPRSHRSLTARISAAAEARVLSVDYRLSVEAPYPAAVEDALAATRWAWEHGAAPETTVLIGDSAGGGLAMLAALALRDAGGPQSAAIVLLSPWLDLTLSAASFDENTDDVFVARPALGALAGVFVRDAVPLEDPRVSPLFADLAGLPPVLVFVSETEAVRDDGVRLVENIRAEGGEATLRIFGEMEHVWPLFDFLPEAGEVVAEIGALVRAQVRLSA